eukprot:852271-Amphidinium_carterae.1
MHGAPAKTLFTNVMQPSTANNGRNLPARSGLVTKQGTLVSHTTSMQHRKVGSLRLALLTYALVCRASFP